MKARSHAVNKSVFTVAVGDPPRLDALLAARLAISVEDAAQLVARGAVHLDGRRCRRPDAPLAAGARLIVYRSPIAESPSLPVVYSDRWLAVVDKPAGVPSQATRGDAAAALDARVQALLGPETRMMHRLDREASGLVLFAVAAAARRPLQAALAAGAVDRRYLALAAGRLEGAGRIELRIARDPDDARRRRALPAGAAGGQPAASRWRVLARSDDASAVELTLETGRTHQLRVHLAALGHPLVGDALYGGPPAPRLCLHAHRLALPHPDDGRRLVVRAPLPDELARLMPALTIPDD
jgi:23S rRNA pseudouridine1911/1915/1917 synthase